MNHQEFKRIFKGQKRITKGFQSNQLIMTIVKIFKVFFKNTMSMGEEKENRFKWYFFLETWLMTWVEEDRCEIKLTLPQIKLLR